MATKTIRTLSLEQEEEYQEEEEIEVVLITPQSDICSKYESHNEKDMREICADLLELKEAILNQHDMPCYQAFLRLSSEAKNVNKEVFEIRNNCSSYKSLVQDLSNGYFRQLDFWKELKVENKIPHLNDLLNSDIDQPTDIFLQNLDILILEHKTEEALSMILDEKEHSENSSLEINKRKKKLADQLVAKTEQPCAKFSEVKKYLDGLIKLGNESLAHKSLLKSFTSNLQQKIDSFIQFSSFYPNTYTSTLSQLVFSTILEAMNECISLFGENEGHGSNFAEWAESEIENFVRVVKENSPSHETLAALHSAAICIEASLTYCAILDLEGLKLSDFLMFVLSPYIEEVINFNFKKARRRVVDLVSDDDLLGKHVPTGSHNDVSKKFMLLVKDILDQLTPMAILHFRPIIMRKTHQLFNKFIEELIKVFPSNKAQNNNFKSQLIIRQVLLLNSIFAICDELLPLAISKMLQNQGEIKQKEIELTKKENINSEFRIWRRQIQRSCDKIRDHFCWQYVLSFIYTHEGKTRLNAMMYLEIEEEYSLEDYDWIPSLPFRAFFARLQQLESLISDIVAGKEKVQKYILSRTVETVLMWLLKEKEFWDLIEDISIQVHQNGLQQHILDMHFINEIATFGGYPSKNIHQLVSAIITRAIEAFSARGVDPQSALYEDAWFSHAAKAAVMKLKLAMPISSNSYEFHDDKNNYDVNILLHDNASDSGENSNTSLSVSDEESEDYFASVNNVEIEKFDYFSGTKG